MKCKIVFLGAAGVGKTSIISKFTYSQFSKDYQTTVGIDFFAKSVQIQDKTVNLQIWDTAGQERFHSLVPSYIRDSAIAVIVYDVSSTSTFDEAKEWYTKVVKERGNDATCLLIGNKDDLETKVDHEAVLEFAKQNAIQTIETSALTGRNIEKLFNLIGELAVGPAKTPPKTVEITVQPTSPPQSGGCC